MPKPKPVPNLLARPLTALVFLAATLGTAMAAERELDLGNFTGIEVEAGLAAIITRDATYSVRIQAEEDDDLDKVRVELDGDILRITREESFFDFLFDGGVLGFLFSRQQGPVVRVSAPDLSTLIASAGASIELNESTTLELEISASSGARIAIDTLTSADLTVSVSSGARAELAGTCTIASVEFSSGASLAAEKLNCLKVKVAGSSGGSALISVIDEVTGSVSSGASLTLNGTPEAIDVSASSGGSVNVR